MKRHYGQTKAQRQADWLAKFADALLARRPGLSGHIDWHAAKHYYFRGPTSPTRSINIALQGESYDEFRTI